MGNQLGANNGERKCLRSGNAGRGSTAKHHPSKEMTEEAKCRDCPKMTPSWCPIRAIWRKPHDPACKYGLSLIAKRKP